MNSLLIVCKEGRYLGFSHCALCSTYFADNLGYQVHTDKYRATVCKTCLELITVTMSFEPKENRGWVPHHRRMTIEDFKWLCQSPDWEVLIR